MTGAVLEVDFRAVSDEGLERRDPARLPKVVAVPAVAYGVCLLTAVVLLFVTMAVTEHWGASRTGNAMMAMLGADAVVFLFSAVAVFALLSRWVSGIGWRLLITGAYLALLAATGLVLAFMSVVIFNR